MPCKNIPSGIMPGLRRTALEESMLLRVDAGWRPAKGWSDRRGCAGADLDAFYVDWKQGRELCRACPVRLDCLAATLATEQVVSEGESAEYFVLGYCAISADRRARYIVDHRPQTTPITDRCGTDSGYYHHRRQLHETPCQPCKDAHSRAQAAYEARRRQRAA